MTICSCFKFPSSCTIPLANASVKREIQNLLPHIQLSLDEVLQKVLDKIENSNAQSSKELMDKIDNTQIISVVERANTVYYSLINFISEIDCEYYLRVCNYCILLLDCNLN